MEEQTWAFLDYDNIVVAIATGDIHTNTLTPEIDYTIFPQAVKVTDKTGIPIVGGIYNFDINKFI
jgi:hypothetical protein